MKLREITGLPRFLVSFYISLSKSIDFTVFSIFMTLLVIAFCILPHFYLFLYLGYFFLVSDSAGGGFFFCTARAHKTLHKKEQLSFDNCSM